MIPSLSLPSIHVVRATKSRRWLHRLGSLLFAGLLTFAAVEFAEAQFLIVPDSSQRAVVQQRISLTDISIMYHRPLVNGRKIWGGLVPYGDVWRAGADENTTIEFSTAVTIEGKPLAKGIYGLHMIPTADSVTVIFSNANTSWGSFTYKDSEDALRVTVKPQPSEMQEALVYEFNDLKPTSAAITLKWDKLAIPFNISINEEETTLPLIRKQLRGILQYTWEGWYSAANFCYQRKINLEEALKWADRSIQVESRFENMGLRADILKALNRPQEAATAQAKALEIANVQQLYFYARQMQFQKKGDEALEVFKGLVKRFPDPGVYNHLAKARLASAAGDYATALKEAKEAAAVTPDDQQKTLINALIKRLENKEDINK